MDHIVLRTNAMQPTMQSLERQGVSLRRFRDDIYPGISQAFYLVSTSGGGKVIIEMVGPSETKTKRETKTRRKNMFPSVSAPLLWGITLVSVDLDATKRYLDGRAPKAIEGGRKDGGMSTIRAAMQRKRHIATLRNRNFGIAPAVAVMTPSQAKSSTASSKSNL